jgi:hypothetical protein
MEKIDVTRCLQKRKGAVVRTLSLLNLRRIEAPNAPAA